VRQERDETFDDHCKKIRIIDCCSRPTVGTRSDVDYDIVPRSRLSSRDVEKSGSERMAQQTIAHLLRVIESVLGEGLGQTVEISWIGREHSDRIRNWHTQIEFRAHFFNSATFFADHRQFVEVLSEDSFGKSTHVRSRRSRRAQGGRRSDTRDLSEG
jgi:hypothetical protein